MRSRARARSGWGSGDEATDSPASSNAARSMRAARPLHGGWRSVRPRPLCRGQHRKCFSWLAFRRTHPRATGASSRAILVKIRCSTVRRERDKGCIAAPHDPVRSPFIRGVSPIRGSGVVDDLHGVLHVDASADYSTIRTAYRALAAVYHPDHAGADGEPRMCELNAAWEVLRDPQRRAAYDTERRANRPAPAPTGPAAPPWTGRAGPPPGHPSGSLLTFGVFAGWSLGEIARVDPGPPVARESSRRRGPCLGRTPGGRLP
jgi:hypothetical protein